MNSQQILIHDVLIDHPVKVFFQANIIKCLAGQARFTFKLRDEFSGRDFESAGVLGLVVDYVARTLGNTCLEHCFLLEQEIRFYSHKLKSSLMVNASIESLNDTDAAFYCEIFSLEKPKNHLIAESRGTLWTSRSLSL